MRPDEARRLWDDGTADLLAVIDRIPLREGDYDAVNAVVWSVAKDPDAGADRHRAAARLAETVHAGFPMNFFRPRVEIR